MHYLKCKELFICYLILQEKEVEGNEYKNEY